MGKVNRVVLVLTILLLVISLFTTFALLGKMRFMEPGPTNTVSGEIGLIIVEEGSPSVTGQIGLDIIPEE